MAQKKKISDSKKQQNLSTRQFSKKPCHADRGGGGGSFNETKRK